MRRKDREITDVSEILEIIKRCDVCNLALCDGDMPYVVPLNFGWQYERQELKLYFHGANAGKKLCLLSQNPRAAFTMHTAHNYLPGTAQAACEATMEYESVCGSGSIRVLPMEEKRAALAHLMRQYEKREEFIFEDALVEQVAVLEMTVEQLSGKRLKKKIEDRR